TEKWNLRRLAYLRTQNLEELVRLSIGGLYDEQKKLERSEAYFRNLTENALDLITLLDLAGIVRYQSASIHPVLGYRPEEISGKLISDFVHPDDSAAFGQALANAREKRRSDALVFAFRMRHLDGSWRELEARANNLLAEPAVCGMVLNSR